MNFIQRRTRPHINQEGLAGLEESRLFFSLSLAIVSIHLVRKRREPAEVSRGWNFQPLEVP